METAIKKWVEIGTLFRSKNGALVDRSNQIINQYAIPTQPEQVDATVKALTTTYNSLVAERKDTTRIFDDIIAKMMEPEKKVAAHLDTVRSEGLKLKVAEEARIKAINEAKQKDAAEIAAIENAIADYITSFVTRSTQYITDNYHADLNAGVNNSSELVAKVKPENLFLPQREFSEKNKHMYVLSDERKAKLLEQYRTMVISTYANFNADLNNIAEAMKRKEEEAQKLQEQIQLQAEQKKAEAEFNSMVEAQPIVLSQKATKKAFQITVTEENHRQIAIAYAMNYDQLKQYVAAKKFESLTVGQMANYLCKAKMDGIDINIEGINYEEISKL